MALILRYAVRSDQGLVRGNNEDSAYAGPRLIAIADGMGGHAAGEVASRIVISALQSLDEDRPIADLVGELRGTIEAANHGIEDAVRAEPELDGMGTTLSALRFADGRAGLMHVGDSRAYLLRDDALEQITRDDTYVQHLVDTGKITPAEAKDHPRKSVILRALRGVDVDPDVIIREVRNGDRYMLCTDGLSDVVSNETIAEALRLPDPQEAADRLVELALRGGGPDNVTVIVADVAQARAGDEVPDVPVIAGAIADAASSAPAPALGDETPAERAARIVQPTGVRPAAETAEPPRSRWRRRRPWVIALAVLILLGGGLGGGYAWAQTQYFVGDDGEDVAIFQGINTAIGPLKLYSVAQGTELPLAELEPSARAQVLGGIPANDLSDAQSIVGRLQQHVLPPCPAPSSTSSLSASPSGSASSPASPSASATKSSPAKSSPAKSSPAKSSPAKSSSAKAQATSAAPKRTTSSKRTPTVTTPKPTSSAATSPSRTTSPSPTARLQPGVDCRTAS